MRKLLLFGLTLLTLSSPAFGQFYTKVGATASNSNSNVAPATAGQFAVYSGSNSIAGKTLSASDITSALNFTPANTTAVSAETSRAMTAEALGLIASNNLSDLTNVSTARTNLGLGNAAVLGTGTGVGQVVVNSAASTITQNTSGTASNITGTLAGSQVGTGISASNVTTGTLPHAQLPALVSGDIPANAANTTGTAANITGTLAGSQVGTGINAANVSSGVFNLARMPVVQPYGLEVYGDSTTVGWGSTDYSSKSAAAILATDIGGVYRNFGQAGDTMEEISMITAQNYVRPPLSTVNNTYRRLFVMLQGGINNANLCANTTAGCLTNYNLALDATLNYLTQPTDNYIFASAATTSGSWATDTLPGITAAIAGGTPSYSITNGNTMTFTVPNSGSKVGLTWIGFTNAHSQGTFTVAVDGTLQTGACSGTTTFYAYGCGSGFTFTGGTGGAGPTLQRQSFAVTAGQSHTIVVTITSATGSANPITIFAADTNRAYTTAYPVPIVSMSGVMQSADNGTAPASFAAYDSAASTATSAKIADGAPNLFFTNLTANVTYPNGYSTTAINANSASGDMGSSATCPHDGTNSLHPNNCGHLHWAKSIENSALGNGFGFVYPLQGPHTFYVPGTLVLNKSIISMGVGFPGQVTANGGSPGLPSTTQYSTTLPGWGFNLNTDGSYDSAFRFEYDATYGTYATSVIGGLSVPITFKYCGSVVTAVSQCLSTAMIPRAANSIWTYPMQVPQIINGPETLTFSATPTFSSTLGYSRLVLTGNVTSSTLAAGYDGAAKTIQLCQDSTGGRTFVWPTNVKGGMTISANASTCSFQEFRYSALSGYAAWYATSQGVANQ